MAARLPRISFALSVVAIVGLAVIADGPAASRAAPGAHRPALSFKSLYLPALAQGWTWRTASLGDPYSPGLGNPGYEVIDYGISVTFPQSPRPPSTPFEATVRMAAVVTAHDQDAISVDLSGMTVIDVTVNDQPATWALGPGKLWVSIPDMPTLHTIRLEVHFSGTAPTTAVGTDGGLARLGPDATRAWFPSNHHPGQRAGFDFSVTVPDTQVGIANGDHVGTTERNGLRTSAFHAGSDSMAPGDATVLVGPYNVVERKTAAGQSVRHYLLRAPADADAMLRAYERAVDGIADTIGRYPYATVGVVETNSNMAVRTVRSLILLGRNQQSQRLVTIERSIGGQVARLWFGTAIGVASNRDEWLNTGLADYLGLRYAAQGQGPELVRARLAALEWSYSFGVGRDLALDRLPADGSGSGVQTYKAPWSYHGLAQAMGKEAFDRTLNAYFNDRLAARGIADLAALQSIAETAVTPPRAPLGPLFDRLFRQAATPRANLSWAQSGATLHVRVCQFTPQPLAFDLPLGVHAADGGAIATVHVPASAEAGLDMPATSPVMALTPDPEQALLADFTVVPATGAAPAPCSAMPVPPLPTTRSGAMVGAEAADGVIARDGDAGRDVGRAAGAADDPAAEGLLPEDGTRHERPAFVPGDPSIGDDYFPTMGNSGYDVSHYTVKLRIDPDAGRIDADVTLAISSTLAGLDRLSLDFLRLDGEKGMVVQDVTVDDQPAVYQRPVDADKLWVDLPAPVPVGGSFHLRVRYGGTPANGSGLSVGSGPMMYAVNEPDGTRGWLPSNDHPRDKATYRFELTVIRPYVAVANGVKVSETETATVNTAVFEMRQPMASYLATVAAARYRTAEQRGPGDVPITHYFLNDPADGMRVADITPDVLAVFSRLVGPYAFDTYGHNAANGFGGGMENQSMTAMGAGVFSTRTPRGSYGIVAHEAAHQWFGDALSPYTWADLWLNEGFATYFAELWRADDVGPEPLGWRMEALRYTVLANGRNAPVGRPEQADFFGTNTYEKGGWVLHMLRQLVGDRAFWAGMRQYYADHRYGNVTTDDLRAAMEAASGKDLGAFFEQWVRRPGNPVVNLFWRTDGATGSVRLCQVGLPFDLPLTLAIHGERSGTPSVTRLDVRLSSDEATVPLDGLPPFVTGITPDPDFATLADFHVAHVVGPLPACGSAAARSVPDASPPTP